MGVFKDSSFFAGKNGLVQGDNSQYDENFDNLKKLIDNQNIIGKGNIASGGDYNSLSVGDYNVSGSDDYNVLNGGVCHASNNVGFNVSSSNGNVSTSSGGASSGAYFVARDVGYNISGGGRNYGEIQGNQEKGTSITNDKNVIGGCVINGGLSAKSCWGMLVKKLKEKNMITLFTACGEIRDVEFEGNKLIVNVKEDYLFNILGKDKNKEALESILKGIDSRIFVEFVKKKNRNDDIAQNFGRLKDLFGKDLKTK